MDIRPRLAVIKNFILVILIIKKKFYLNIVKKLVKNIKLILQKKIFIKT